MGFIDLFKDFHREAIRQEFPTSARVLYDTLLYEFNGRYWTEEIGFSVRDLSLSTGLPVSSTHRAIKFLSERGYIKTFRTKQGTGFKLLGDNVPPANGTPMEHQRNSGGTVTEQSRNTFENPNIRVREDLKDFKTKDLQSIAPPRACAPVNWDCENELVTLWLDNGGARVTAELLSYLQALVEKHGVEWTESAIRETASSYGGDFRISLKYFRSCVERKLKGGDKRAKTRVNRSNVLNFSANTSGKGRFDDDEPDTSWIYEQIEANRTADQGA